MGGSSVWIIRALFAIRRFMTYVIIWMCPHGLFLKINKMPLLRKKLIASIDNSLNRYDGNVNEIRDFNKIDSIFRYFGFTNKVVTERFYASGTSHQSILPRDLQDIKDQIMHQ